MITEVEEKLARLRALLRHHDLDAVVLRTIPSVAWLSCGGRTHVLLDMPAGLAAVVVGRDRLTVVTSVIEAERLQTEELRLLGEASYDTLPWDRDLGSALPTGARVGADAPYADVVDISAELVAARTPLLPEEVERYRELGADTAAALTDACAALSPESTEYEATGRVAAALADRGIDPLLLLAAGGDRLPRWRHPLPTLGRLGGLGMLVVCARRAGLYANASRLVAFAPLDEERRGAYARLLQVEAAFLGSTRPGARVADAFAAGATSYAAHGFDPDEWRRHHQGGPTGYASRDEIASSSSESVVRAPAAFAWNPSVAGLKVEDTVLIGEDGSVEVLTADPRWPSVEVDGRLRPQIWQR